MKASVDDPISLENAGYAIFDMYPERRGNLFADEVSLFVLLDAIKLDVVLISHIGLPIGESQRRYHDIL